MDEKLIILESDSEHIGKSCSYCEEKFVAGDEFVECPRCHSYHHADCWKQKGGCAKRGCAQIAKNVVGERPKGDGLPPPIPRKHVFIGIGVVLVIIIVSIFWPQSPDPAAGRIKIEVLLEVTMNDQDEMNRIINDFNTASEDIYIELQTSSLSIIENQLVVRMAAGDAPDIFSLPYARFEAMQDQIGAMYPLGDSSNPAYGVQHPSQLRVMSVFVHTEHPAEALTVFRYLLEEMPRHDLTELKEQSHLIDPELMIDIDTFLTETSPY